MCTCIKDVQDKVTETITKQYAENGKTVLELDYNEGLKGVGLTLTSTLGVDKERMFTDFVFKSSFKKKDQTESKPVKNTVSVFFTFCPFCGVKYVTEEDIKGESGEEKEAEDEK